VTDASEAAGAAPERSSLEQWLDVTLYAPLGLALELRDQWPRYVSTGRQAVENRVQLARFIGRLAVQQARVELGKRMSSPPAPDPSAARDATAPADDPASDLVADVLVPADDDGELVIAGAADPAPEPVAADDLATPDAGDLPISDYASLAAVHVVQRLATLRPDELEQVRRFEVAHRGRRTILAKVAQLQGD